MINVTTIQATDLRLEEIMTRLAADDMGAMFDLTEEYGHRIRGVVRSIVRKTGRHDILNDPDEIACLTMDAVLMVVRYAASWNPEGALPWIWRYKAIRKAVWSGIGHRVVELEEWNQGEVRVPASGPSSRGLRVDHVFQIADSRPELKLFLDVLGEEASERDVGVVLEYELQKVEGVRAPSETTALLSGLAVPNVRKIASRTRKKMVRRVGTDPALAVLEGFWFLAGGV